MNDDVINNLEYGPIDVFGSESRLRAECIKDYGIFKAGTIYDGAIFRGTAGIYAYRVFTEPTLSEQFGPDKFKALFKEHRPA
ncbi:MAG TPA: hypothetical protein VJ464_01365 [Blastocatellia bacterium]|nr:hypothetical protein [Blastocatellia bacterium]